MHDNSVKKAASQDGAGSVLPVRHTCVLEEQADSAEHAKAVTDDHQSILKWPAWGRERREMDV